MRYVVIKYIGNTLRVSDDRTIEDYEFSDDINYLRYKYSLPIKKITPFDYNLDIEGFSMFKKELNFGYLLVDTNVIKKDNVFSKIVRRHLEVVLRDFKITSLL